MRDLVVGRAGNWAREGSYGLGAPGREEDIMDLGEERENGREIKKGYFGFSEHVQYIC